MLRIVAMVSGPDSPATIVVAATVVVGTGAREPPLCVTVAPGWRTSGCVCCILIVALGIPGFPPSGGRVMRAVSFFGEAGFWVTGSTSGAAPGAGGLEIAETGAAGAGLSGTDGFGPSDGGFGGGMVPLTGLSGPVPSEPGGLGGGGTKGLAPEADGGGGGDVEGAEGGTLISGTEASSAATIFVVSFFGPTPGGSGAVGAGLPGRLIRTVSRLAVGCSGFDGRVMRIVSAFDASSADSEGAGGMSSGIKNESGMVHLTGVSQCQYHCPHGLSERVS